MNISCKHLVTIIMLITGSVLTARAQKQPQIQEVSIRAPDGIKIDGNLQEWPSVNLNAYNLTNRIYYVISNDDNNLYLTVRGMGNGVAKKAIAGGLVFTINRAAGKKTHSKTTDNVTITFPVPQNNKTVASIMSTINQVMDYTDDPVANRKQIDSIVLIGNRLMNSAMKEIYITGVKETPDSVVSIYNTIGIKAAAQFIRMQPVIELAIPLKYMGLNADNPVSFSYNIRLNAIPQPQATLNIDLMKTENEAFVNPNVGFAFNATDFWGDYTLAKKP